MSDIAVRRMFKPDPGYVLVDADLKGADARIVAWDSGAEKLKALFRAGLALHHENAKTIYGACDGPEDIRYQTSKNGVHAVNYICKPRTLAATLKVTILEAERFTNTWFAAHPEIPRWHDSIERQLRTRGYVKNIWGFRRIYFDRVDAVLAQAVAWIGQSTTAITINKAMKRIEKELPYIELLLQVHDSLLMQVPEERFPNCLDEIRSCMSITIPYPDPLIIPVTLKTSAVSWADCEEQ